MTAAVITLAVALAGALAAIGVLVYALLGSLKSERASLKAELDADDARSEAAFLLREAERARDEALADAAKATSERDAANDKLAKTQHALNHALEEKADATVQKIRDARDAEHALAALTELFATVPRGAEASVPAVPAGDDHGHAR